MSTEMEVRYIEPKLGVDIPYKLTGKFEIETKTIKHDGIEFYTTRFPATGTKKGKVLILHGWCEHCSMYHRIMEYLSTLGYESFVYDQRGAGRTSPGKYRGRCGRDPNKVYTDFDKMVEVFNPELFNKNGDNQDFFLLGHSAGGGIALNYMINGKYRNMFTGIITTGPLIKIAENLTPSPIIEYALNFIATYFPYTPYGSINRDPNVKSTITTATEWVDYLQQELMTQGNCTLGQIKDMFDRGYKLANVNHEELNLKHDLRLLTIHCENDPMTSFKQSKRFFDKLPLNSKKFVKLEKGNHSLFIETEEVFRITCDEISKFLDGGL